MATDNKTSTTNSPVPLYAGIDIGGTNIKVGLVDDSGQTLAYLSILTHAERGPEDGTRRMAEAFDNLLAETGVDKAKVARIGVASPGPLDLKTGTILTPGNLPEWWNFPIRDKISKACSLPVRFANDANAAAYGEYWRGTGEKADSMILLTLGTGIGGGIIVDGMLIEGAHGCGGECGHVLIDPRPDARRDSLDKSGSLEAYCGAYAVVARAEEAIENGRDSKLSEEAASGTEITPLIIAQAAEAGDRLAREIVFETGTYLGLGIVTLIHTIDPEMVVLGGAMDFGGAGHPLGEAFLQRIREEVESRTFEATRGKVELNFAQLGGDAGYIGAAGLARLEHNSNQAN